MWLIQLILSYSSSIWASSPSLASGGDTSLPASAALLQLTTPDNTLLRGVWIPAGNASEVMQPWIIGFGGNAWNANTVATYLHMLFPDHEVVAFHYRGYKPSGGQPSAHGLLVDAILIFDHVREKLGARKVLAVGFSIGSGVAAHLASKRPLA